MRSRTVLAAAIAAALACVRPGIALACPYCAGSRDAGTAYLISAVGMGLLPVGLGLGLVLWLRRRLRPDAPEEPAAGGTPSDVKPRA